MVTTRARQGLLREHPFLSSRVRVVRMSVRSFIVAFAFCFGCILCLDAMLSSLVVLRRRSSAVNAPVGGRFGY